MSEITKDICCPHCNQIFELELELNVTAENKDTCAVSSDQMELFIEKMPEKMTDAFMRDFVRLNRTKVTSWMLE